MSVTPDLLTVRQAARLIGCSEKTVTEQARRKKLAGHKKGKYWRIELASAERYRREVATRRPQPILEDAEAMETLYRDLGTYDAVAKELGISKATVGYHLRRHGIHIPDRSQVARKTVRPEPTAVKLKRWMDVYLRYHRRGLVKAGIRPPRPQDLCPRDCEGRDRCLDGVCVMAGNGNGGNL